MKQKPKWIRTTLYLFIAVGIIIAALGVLAGTPKQMPGLVFIGIIILYLLLLFLFLFLVWRIPKETH